MFKDWLKAINTKRGLSFSYLTNFVQNQKLIKWFFSKMANVDLWVTTNDLQGQMDKKFI